MPSLETKKAFLDMLDARAAWDKSSTFDSEWEAIDARYKSAKRNYWRNVDADNLEDAAR